MQRRRNVKASTVDHWGRYMKLRTIVATITVAALFFFAPSTVPVKAVPVGPCGPTTWLTADTALAFVPVPCPAGGTSSAAGATATGVFIGVVTFLATYDFVRRMTCMGDPLSLGGPGFGEPMPAAGNILPPQCKNKGRGR
jgi:hypothetical protein